MRNRDNYIFQVFKPTLGYFVTVEPGDRHEYPEDWLRETVMGRYGEVPYDEARYIFNTIKGITYAKRVNIYNLTSYVNRDIQDDDPRTWFTHPLLTMMAIASDHDPKLPGYGLSLLFHDSDIEPPGNASLLGDDILSKETTQILDLAGVLKDVGVLIINPDPEQTPLEGYLWSCWVSDYRGYFLPKPSL